MTDLRTTSRQATARAQDPSKDPLGTRRFCPSS
jgi:hypothetical protein